VQTALLAIADPERAASPQAENQRQSTIDQSTKLQQEDCKP
jgi:hypothetical protein